jgi:GntR family transcriptional regulator
VDWCPQVTTELRFESATVEVAADLRIEVGAEVLVRARTWAEDGEVVALATSYIARSVSVGTAIELADTGPGGVLACLIDLGHQVTRHVERVTAGTADDDEAVRFARHDHPAVIRVERATMSRRRVLAVIRIAVLADRFELCYELPMAH